MLCCTVSVPGPALHPPGPGPVQRQLSVSGCSPAAVCPPAGAGDRWTGWERQQQHETKWFWYVSAHLSVFTFLDESSELQTQICNAFKSLVVQLQGESAASAASAVKLCFCVSSCFFLLSAEILNKCKGDLLEMKETKLKTQPSLLETLIFFVEVRRRSHGFGSSPPLKGSVTVLSPQTLCVVLWVASYCARILRPLKTSLQKKKKKKKDSNTALVHFLFHPRTHSVLPPPGWTHRAL